MEKVYFPIELEKDEKLRYIEAKKIFDKLNAVIKSDELIESIKLTFMEYVKIRHILKAEPRFMSIISGAPSEGYNLMGFYYHVRIYYANPPELETATVV